MAKVRRHKRIIFTFALLFLLSAPQWAGPSLSFAGSEFKEKIQKKLNTPSNIQYEPYRERQSGGFQTSTYDAGLLEKRADSPQTVQYQPQQEMANAASPSCPPARDAIIPTMSRYAIYQTNYTAELEDNVVTVKGNVVFQVFQNGWTQLPLVRSDVGLIDVSVNRGTAFVTTQNGKYYLMIDKAGKYTLNMEFLIKAAREREHGPGSFNFDVMPAPISQFEFTIPETGVEIFVDPAIKTEVKKETGKTMAWAIMPNTNSITARWTKELPKEEITPVKLESKIYADVLTLASIGEGVVNCASIINYTILQSEVSTFRIAIPEEVSLLNVQGNDLRDWKISEDKEKHIQYLDVYYNFGVKGNNVLTINYEKSIGEGSTVAEIPTVKTLGTERENGHVGIAAKTNVELAVNKIERVTPIDVKELPSSIWGLSANPLLLAFKYLSHPFNIAIDVTRHQELAVLVAAIDNADYITLQTQEGKVLTKATYQVRNNVKQFLRLVLPEGATLWSTFVAGKPVKPAKDKKGNILIPLEKSQMQGESLTQFPVEIVYLGKGGEMKLTGEIRLNLPKTDIPISQVNWGTFFPFDYTYFQFGGDVKHLEQFNPGILRRGIQGRLQSAADDIGDKYSPGNSPVSSIAPQYGGAQQAYYGKEEGLKVLAQTRGVLPIKIDVPQDGEYFRFSKLLVTEDESPRLTVRYVTMPQWICGAMRPVVGMALLLTGLFFIVRLERRRKRNLG